MSRCRWVYLGVPACLSACLSVCLSVCLYVCLSVYPNTRTSICMLVCLLVCRGVYVSVCLGVSACISWRDVTGHFRRFYTRSFIVFR